MKIVPLMLFVILTFLAGCKKNVQSEPADELQTIENMKVDPAFHFNTASEISLQITTLDNADHPVPNIQLTFYTDYPENGGNEIMTCNTGSDAVFTGTLKIATCSDSIVLGTGAIGFVQWQKRKITGEPINWVLGGKTPQLLKNGTVVDPSPGHVQSPTLLGVNMYVKPLGSFNAAGVPNNLSLPNDVIDASFLTDISHALPESKPVPTYHPEYLLPGNQSNLLVDQAADVWVTYIHEGASYRNVLCYYKYQVNNPPVRTSDIDTLFAIFPNVSYVNSGGGLISGNKVKIGTFQPGTGIGWALIANGYNGTAITNGLGIFYSQSELNPETNVNLKKHCLLLNDINRGKLLLSFEDVNRQNGCDNDFNDAIFYVTANPIQAINVSGIARPAYSPADADLDGVADNFDEYPTDASKAFNNYYPAKNIFSTLAFEDLWPSRGDYDLNDMIIDYNFNSISNAQNKVVQIKASITIKAIGASYHSGFGIQLPVDPSLVASITGTDVRGTIITRNANGTEAGQSKATIIVFDDAFSELPWPGGGTGVNTTAGAPFVSPKTLNLEINFRTPVTMSSLGSAPFNAFIFTDQHRGNEVHLINKAPTDLVNRALLGTQADNSNPAIGRYYVTTANLPFAIDIAGTFDYPAEKKVITNTHLMFYQWGVSNGTLKKDWYKPLPGFRKPENIFSH